jgi:hypothetical protein
LKLGERDQKSTLSLDGGECHRGAIGEAELAAIERLFLGLPIGRAGIRLHSNPDLAHQLARSGPIGLIAAQSLGHHARPVRAILFDKHAEANWSLTWHQDRTIVVRERIDAPGYGPWTIKSGLIHVAPPFGLLERMLTLRVHLDRVTTDNAPLLIAPGSHRLGRIAETEIDSVVARCGQMACLAERGDIWAYSTPILHASAASRSITRRRVLQIDYSADNLDAGLEWLGVG